MSDYFNFSSSPMIPSTNLGNSGMFQSMGGKNPFSLPSSGAVTNKKETNSQNFVQRFLGNLKKWKKSAFQTISVALVDCCTKLTRSRL